APSRPSSLFSFSPAQLTVQEGANATFTCSFSNWSEHLVLNWYRLSPSKQNIKLASFHKGLSEPGRDPRFQVTRLPNGLDFHMSVLSARCNDSGLYLCGVISLSSKVQIQETPAAELRVTDRVLESLTLEPPTAHPRPSPRPASQFPGLAVGVTSVLVGVPVVLLLAWILATTCSRAMPDSERVSPQRLEEPEAKSSPWLPDEPLQHPLPLSIEKEEATAVPVFALDYGELDFEWREKTPTPEPPASCIHTEYATIVFPPSPGRRGSADSPQERSTEIGKLLSSYLEKKSELEDHSVHLLFSANRWEHVPSMKEKLGQGITLVVDRYAFSGVAFTSAKKNFSLDWCKQPDVGLPQPDLVLFLQLGVADAATRGEFGLERYEDRAFQKRALQSFQQLMGDSTLNWKVVDASRSIEDVHQEIRVLSEDAICNAAQRPLGALWT
ncbi:Thymidylate kinase, partial [Sciurus carolinensis]|nr:Thymidylate kinase [Sciurus carolinensis]